MEIKIKSNKNLLLLLIIPIAFAFFLHQIKVAQGPYHHWQNVDPSYVYLFNSVNLTYGQIPGHIDHPGTILQYLGALVLEINYLISGTEKTLVEDVIKYSEKYLDNIAYFIIFLNVLASFLLGCAANKLFKNVWIGLYLQLVPFFFMDLNLFNITRIAAESLLGIFSLGFVFLCILFWFKEEDFSNKTKYIFIFALCFVLGVITKITFVPMGIFPFLLIKKWSRKLYFLLLSGLLFVLDIFPK